MGTAADQRQRPAVWVLYLVVGLTATLAVLSLRGAAAVLAFGIVQLLGAVTGFVAVHRQDPGTAAPWRLIALGFTFATLGFAAWLVATPLQGWPPFFIGVGTLFMAKQVLLAWGLIRMVPDRSRLDATLDGTILAAGAAVGLWTFLGGTILRPGPLGGLGTTTGLAYLAVDLTVLAAVGRLLFVTGVPGPAGVLLLGSVAALLIGDAGYCAGLAKAQLASPSLLSAAGWLLCGVLFGAAALHPRAPEIGRPHPTGPATAAVRVAAFTVFAVVDPVVGALMDAFSVKRTPGSRAAALADSMVPALLVMVLSGLLVLRVVLLLRTSNARAAALRDALRSTEDLQAQLAFRALHDPLTGLGNRALLGERLAEAVRDRFALLMLDLDGFKDINDTLGHPAGDELLVQVAERLRDVIGTGAGVAARLGGDEFAVLLPGADRPTATERAAAVLAAVRAPYRVAGRQLYLTTSIGVLAAPRRRRSPGDAMRDADIALYAAKSAGKNQIVVFDPALREARGERARLATGLRRALVDDALSLHYQPVVDLNTGAVHAVEALLRWHPPGHRPVSPAEFVPVAEETGLIVPIGSWVLDRALRQGREWYDRYGTAVSVNVSALQVATPTFADEVLDALRRADLPGAGLMLELTESVLISQGKRDEGVSARLNRLREHGVRVAVDDFGTGYSSLSYLWQLPVDVLKIDHSFTGYLSGPGPQQRRVAFLRAILEVGRSLALQTIAEGVESPEEARRLRGMGCRYVQGYLFAAPLPAVAMAEYLARPVATHDRAG